MTMDIREESCHCGKNGHALNSVNCPVHGTAAQARAKGQPGVDGLLPCPFCGELPETWDEPGISVQADRRHYVGCINIPDCSVEPTLYALSAEDAIARWNTRSTPSNPGGYDAGGIRWLLLRCKNREYNSFEPDNQSTLYHDICRAIALLQEPPPTVQGEGGI